MIDHALGKPSHRYRKYQIFTVVLLWSVYLSRGNRHGPPLVRKISAFLSKHLTPWHTMVITMLYMYLMRNFSRLVGLEPREPLAGKYDRDYFRATWVATALDAGFWKAMWLRPKWLRDFASIGITLYYLVCAEQADEYVRKVRSGGNADIDHMRVSWNKGRTPYIRLASRLMRPTGCMKRPPIRSRIERPAFSDYKEPIDFWLYFDHPQEELKRHNCIVLDIPGGGFVAMDPRCHDDKLLSWAGKSGLPVVALNYKKAPEYPYPYALEECFEAYIQIVLTKGKCIGLSGETMPKIVLTGDSAGGNLAAGLIIKLLETSPHSTYDNFYRNTRLSLPLPEALIMVYPALDMNITSFMRPDDVELMNLPEYRKANKNLIKRKSEDHRRLTPKTPHGSDDEEDSPQSGTPQRTTSRILTDNNLIASPIEASSSKCAANGKASVSKPRQLRTNVKMSSMITHLHDRVLPPELLRAMILLYIGSQHKPNFQTDYLLSPLLAPAQLLAHFPKVYMLCGEQDPLVDGTITFAGRLRQAKYHRFKERRDMGLDSEGDGGEFDQKSVVEYFLIEGVSHGFLQFVSVYHPGWNYIDQCRRWAQDAFDKARDRDNAEASVPPTPAETEGGKSDYFDEDHKQGERDSDAEDWKPLEMTPLRKVNEMEREREKKNGRSEEGSSEPQRRRGESSRSGMRRNVYASGRRSPVATRKPSMVRLASTENLMDRRMHGLTGQLMGRNGGAETP